MKKSTIESGNSRNSRRRAIGQLGAGAAALAALGATAARAKPRDAEDSARLEANKAVVGRWFDLFWGKDFHAGVVKELAAPDMLLKYSLHAPRRGQDDILAFISNFRSAFPDLAFSGTAALIAEGDHVVGQWIGGGTHTGPAFDDFIAGGLRAATGRRMWFSGTTVLKVVNGRIQEELGLDDGVTALQQLGLIRKA